VKTATISEAKNRLSAYLRLVKRGEEILILDRTVPVARLVPVEFGKPSDNDEARIADVERRGIIKSGKERGRGIAKLLREPPPKPKEPIDLVKFLIEERESGW
jgi:prevent-host-death family protein